MNDVILRIRADAIEHQIARLKTVLTQLERRVSITDTVRKSIRETQAEASELTDSLTQLGQQLGKQIRSLQDNDEPVSDTVLEAFLKEVREAERKSESLRTRIRKDGSGMDALLIQAFAFAFPNEMFRKSFVETVTERTEQYGKQVAEVRKQLDSDRSAAWDLYKDHIRRPVQDFFSETVELLGGVALRDTKLDHGICALADELVTHYRVDRDSPPISVLTLPARQKAISMTLARIVRVGFPEWTIWALPLTAHEFWYVVGRKVIMGPDGSGQVSGTPVDEALPQCLADAFATWLIGPAYPYAQIVLGLDPFEAFTASADEASDDDRVQAMLAMLECVNKAGGGGSFTDVIDDLSKGWSAALKFASPGRVSDGARCTAIKSAIEGFYKKLVTGAFSTVAWDAVSELSQQLADIDLPPVVDDNDVVRVHTELDKMDLALPQDPELRHLLNAAWRARVRSPEHADRIETNTKTLWTYVVRKRKSAGRAGADRALRLAGSTWGR